MNQAERDALLADNSKVIDGDIRWVIDESHSGWAGFRADIDSEAGYPLFVNGSYRRDIGKLYFSLIHKGAGRIAGLCFGTDHHNPDCKNVGEPHRHMWSEQNKDKFAEFADIEVDASDPSAAWDRFMQEMNIVHKGAMLEPPPMQRVF